MIEEYLYSDENIVHAIYEANNAIHEKKLLQQNERQKLNDFKDIFNNKLIIEEVKIIRKKLQSILEGDEFFEAQVYFSAKGIDKDKNRKYRPIHTASLTDQICMIAMLNTITNDFSVYNSNIISREIRLFTPSNFYGNILSEKPDRIYERWQDSYSSYIKKSIELQNEYNDSFKYRYEITLDLQDFFPSINPEFVITCYMQHVGITLNDNEKAFLEKILRKLLYIKCKIKTQNSEMSLKHDYKKEYCGDKLKEGTDIVYVRGIAQGLVQGGFFANLAMVEIAKIYDEIFQSEQIFYVDDTIMYSNILNDLTDEKQRAEKFKQLISICETKINEYIDNKIKNKSDKKIIESEYKYKISINADKSSYLDLSSINQGQIYLKNMSMLVSQVKSEIMSDFDTEDIIILKNKLHILVKQIEKEINEIDKLGIEEKKNFYEYRKRLVRYKKYFKYRFYILQFRENCNIKQISSEIQRLYDELSKSLKNNNNDDGIDVYNDDIIGPLVTYFFDNMNNDIRFSKNTNLVKICKSKMMEINKLLYYMEDNTFCSYFYKLYEEYLCDEYRKFEINDNDKYSTLISLTNKIFKNKRNLSEDVKRDTVKNYLKNVSRYPSKCYKIINIEEDMKLHSIINGHSDELYRMIINATICGILNITISDEFDFLKKGNKLLKYNELRVLSIIRNKEFKYNMLLICKEIYSEESNVVDYSILEVMSVFQHFVKKIEYIDKLIITHQYVCSVWRNGSKYLYFYTLHNQEHAIALIKNSVEIIKSINFLRIKRVDYYILFMACYLHDISMVNIPDYSSFYKDAEASNLIVRDFINDIKNDDVCDFKYTKIMMMKFYRAIDLYLENVARESHAKDSADVIRHDSQIKFLDDIEKEIIAQVSEAHGYELRDVYRRKSEAQKMVCSIKYLKIVLRLADLLDMKKSRISKELLQKNINKMEDISVFHWISHLLINDLKIKVKYKANDNDVTKWILLPESANKSFISRYMISEKLIFEIHIGKMILDKFNCNKKCSGINMQEKDGNIILDIIEPNEVCDGKCCNIACKWFERKNYYLIKECIELKRYLSDIPDNYFDNQIQIKIVNDDDAYINLKYIDIIKKGLREDGC